MSDIFLTVSLPSLIHRVGGDPVKRARALAAEHQCQLKRIRRSRHWQLTGAAPQLDIFCRQLEGDETLRYMRQKIEQTLLLHPELLESKADKLKRLIAHDPTITLAELMAETKCTLSEARTARLDSDIL